MRRMFSLNLLSLCRVQSRISFRWIDFVDALESATNKTNEEKKREKKNTPKP